MNGAHDLGGMHGLGAIDPEPQQEEPVFHEPWERRAFAVTLACGFLGQWNLDELRHARERQHPVDYLRHGYYENWLAGLEKLLEEKNLVSAAELETGRANGQSDLAGQRIPAERVADILAHGGPVDVTTTTAPGFSAGDRVRVRNAHPTGHTRAPRYVRGRTGVVVRHHGCHVFPDANASGERRGEHLYSVRFAATELWGDDTPPGDGVFVDLWQPYLETAT